MCRNLFVLLALGVFAFSPVALARTFTDNQGNKISAKFIRIHEGRVILNRGGRAVTVPFSNFSPEDQDYIREEMEKKGKGHLVPRRPGASDRTLPGLDAVDSPDAEAGAAADAQKPGAPRTWTDAKGRTTEAQFVGMSGEKVVLLKEGRRTSFPFDDVSPADQQYVRRQMAARGQGHLVPGGPAEAAAAMGSMPGMLGSTPRMPGTPGSMPGMPGTVPRMPGSMPGTAGMPSSMPGMPGTPGSMPGMPGTVPRMPGSMPGTAGMPGSTPRMPGTPGSMPRMPGTPGSMPGRHGMSGMPGATPAMPGGMPGSPGRGASAPGTGRSPGALPPGISSPRTPSMPTIPDPVATSPGGLGAPSLPQFEMEYGECGKCKKRVSASLGAGDRCPHCGVVWDVEETADGRMINARGKEVSQGWYRIGGAGGLAAIVGAAIALLARLFGGKN